LEGAGFSSGPILPSLYTNPFVPSLSKHLSYATRASTRSGLYTNPFVLSLSKHLSYATRASSSAGLTVGSWRPHIIPI
jgi:hypothetical protein